MNIQPIAIFHSPFNTKFGIPRQSGLVDSLQGRIVFEPQFRNADYLKGIDDFDFLWLIWQFSANVEAIKHATVRPPRLGGNVHLGVWATRSPFRPNNLGLSAVRLDHVEMHSSLGPLLVVRGADLMDGTPIYDIKPYLRDVDCHPDARGGFVDSTSWQSLDVVCSVDTTHALTQDELDELRQILSLDPRPHYHHDAKRIYGMSYKNKDVKFRVENNTLYIIGIEISK